MSTYEELRQQADEAWREWASPARTLIKIGLATCSKAKGAEDTFEAIRDEINARGLDADVAITGCLGLCYAEPLVEVHRPDGRRFLYGDVTPEKAKQLVDAIAEDGVSAELALAVIQGPDVPGVPRLEDIPFFAIQERRLMADCGTIHPRNIDHYMARGGYEGLARALTMTSEEVIKEVLDSGLWGRGGAAFPTGRKWDFLRTARGEPKYILCNADEGDPGSFVNRNLMESNPHLVVEGMIIAGYATGGARGFAYIRDEYPICVERMEFAVQQARERGLLGENIFGSGFSFNMEVVRGAGAYVCGEETGLIASIEGLRGMPKIRPPFPAQAGVFNKPSNVNNVESYANAPLVLRNGAAWWSSVGSERHKGTKMFSLSGAIQRVGILEVPLGISMREVLIEAGGGVPDGQIMKAIQSGGPLSGIIPASDINEPLEPEPFRDRGMFMGSGGLIVLDDTDCIVDLCIYFEQFAEDESCGRCTTCHGGTQRLVEILRRISNGQGRSSDIDHIRLLADTMRYANCVHGQAAPTAVLSMIRFFEDELKAHMQEKRCPAKVCRALICYEVGEQGPNLPKAEAICPTNAVVREATAYRIDQEKCIKCGACKEVVPESIQVLDAYQDVVAILTPL